jgi:hypothetical protein
LKGEIMKKVMITPIEILHASMPLITLGHRIEDLQSRGYSKRDIEQVLSEYKPETLSLASKFLAEVKAIRGKA